MRIRLVTAVWGREYVDTFIRVGLRSLLGKGNLPDLASAHDVVYTIHTTHADADALSQAPQFARLRESVDLSLATFGPGEIDTADYGEHGTFWWRAVELARRNGEVLFFIIPDLVYASGTLMRWAARFEEGKKAIFTLGPQVVLETVVPELETRFPGESAFDLDRDQVLDLLGRHLHPLHAAMRHDEHRRPPHPEYDLRLVPGRGMVIRSMVSHPFCLQPGHFTSLKHYGPEDHLESLAFEPCSTVSVEPLLKRVRGYYRPWRLDAARLSNLGAWWNGFTTAACEHESRHPYDISRVSDEAWRTGRSRAIRAGGFYRAQLIAAGRLYQLFDAFRTHGHFRAAYLLAAAVYAGRMRRRMGVRRRAIVLVPTDKALAGRDGDRVRALLRPGCECQLLDLVGDHVLFGRDEVAMSRRLRRVLERQSPRMTMDDQQLVNAHGVPVGCIRDIPHIAGDPICVGPFTMYPVDRVVRLDELEGRGAVKNGSPSPEMRQPMRPRSDPPAVAGTFAVTRWARKSIFHRALYQALHVPFLELFVALLFPVYFKVPIKNRLRPYAVVHRARDAARRLQERFRAIDLLRWLGPLPRVIGLVRRDGPRLALHKIRIRALGPGAIGETISRPKVGPEAAEKLRQLRAYRALKATEAVLADYESGMGAGPFHSAPLAYVRQLLARHGLEGAPGAEAARALATQLVEREPTWAEPWLERGFMHEDDGDIAGALACFERAALGGRAVDLAPSDPHPSAVAAANCGRRLIAMGRDEEALEAFARALRLDPAQKMAAVQYADLLRRRGDIDRALIYYGDGMYFQETGWCLPPERRNAADVDMRYVAEQASAGAGAAHTPPEIGGLLHGQSRP